MKGWKEDVHRGKTVARELLHGVKCLLQGERRSGQGRDGSEHTVESWCGIFLDVTLGIPPSQNTVQTKRLEVPELLGSDVPSGKAMGVTTNPRLVAAVINDHLESVWRSSGGRAHGLHVGLGLCILHVFVHPAWILLCSKPLFVEKGFSEG